MVFLGFAAISGCAGFTPLYATNNDGTTRFSSVSLAPVEGRAGFLFSQALLERGGIQQGQSAPYVLHAAISTQHIASGVRVDDVSTRSHVEITARYSLVDKNGKAVFSNFAKNTAAYDTPDQPYGALAATSGVEAHAITALAETVMTDIATFLAQQGDPS